jgi:hypothetical protein
MIEVTKEMVQEVYSRIDFVNHGDDGIAEGLTAVLAIVERNYTITPYREGDWADRKCDGCGRSVAARSKVVRVLCVVCHPADLPLGPHERPEMLSDRLGYPPEVGDEEWRRHPLSKETCSETLETKGAVVRCGKKPNHLDNAHLARHDGWDVIW